MVGREVLGDQQGFDGFPIVAAAVAVEIASVAAEREQRDEHGGRKRQLRHPFAPFRDERAYEGEGGHGEGNCSGYWLLVASGWLLVASG